MAEIDFSDIQELQGLVDYNDDDSSGPMPSSNVYPEHPVAERTVAPYLENVRDGMHDEAEYE